MKLFGTVIAVLFHPGSSFRLNGKNDKKEEKPSTATALERSRFIRFALMCQSNCFIIFLCNTDHVFMEFSLFLRALLRWFFK